MVRRRFRVGDKVKIIGIPPMSFAPGVKDELGSEKLFKSMPGKIYTVRGFNKYGHIELRPTRSDFVWIEPELLKLSAARSTKRKR
jgi:hypothetical protein